MLIHFLKKQLIINLNISLTKKMTKKNSFNCLRIYLAEIDKKFFC